MSALRAVVLLATLSAVAATILAFASRAPESVRLDKPSSAATDPSLGASFTSEDIARHGAYRAPGYLSFGLALVLEIATLIVLARGPLARLADKIENVPGGFVTRALLLGAIVAIMLTVVSLPLSFVRGYAMEHAWGLSTQDLGGWLSDKGRSLLVAGVIAAISALAFFSVVRWQPRSWWLWGWAAFTALTALLIFLWPIVIAPLFNRFTPLEDEGLSTRIVALASEAGVEIDRVLVADASKRTTAENAYVAGLGTTKRVVVYDTLLDADDDEVLFVVAHELGHRVENHVLKNVLVASAGLLAGFAVLALLARREGLWQWAGASGISDVRSLPLLLLFAVVAGVAVTPLQSGISRSFERRADEIAFDLTDDPAAPVGLFRRLAFNNLADLDPPPALVWSLFSHPPIPDRIRAALEHRGNTP